MGLTVLFWAFAKLFKHKFYRINWGIQTWIVGVVGEYADHLTTYTAQQKAINFKASQLLKIITNFYNTSLGRQRIRHKMLLKNLTFDPIKR